MGRDGFQGFQHKAPLADVGMGKDDRPVQNGAAIIQKIQVQAARRVGNGTLTAQVRFDFMQKCQQRNGLEPGSDRRDRVQEGRVGGIRPCLGFIEGRNRFDFDPGAGERSQRRGQSFGGRSRLGRNIGAQRYEDLAA